MVRTTRAFVAGAMVLVALALPGVASRAATVKVADPTSVVMIVNRDSNEIAFMDIKTKKIVGKTFLGNNVNPHMVMMSPDGRYVVTGGTRANKAYIIDARTLELVKVIPVDIAPEHLAFSPDGRWYYQGNPEGDSISVIDMVSLTKIKTIPGLVEPLNVVFVPDGSKAYVGNYGAHWVGVIDVRRHELLKKIQIAEVPGVAKLDPAKYLGEIKGINIPQITNDGRFLYAADTDLGVVSGEGSMAHLHEPRRQLCDHAQQRRPDDLHHRSTHRQGGRDARGRRKHDRRELRRGQGVRHQLDERLRVHLRHEDTAPRRPHQGRQQHPARDGDDRRRRRETVSCRLDRERRRHHRCEDLCHREGHERRAVPLGHAHHGQQG
ncbi:MAG: hypothetical protein DMF90_03825 [Acidobacteria bacterium]|nr:MAG: hypothetical protein DMF90_03825 [Acidobacteriota bacterium]